MVDDGAPAVAPVDNDAVFAKLLATIDEDYLAAIEALNPKRAQLRTSSPHGTNSVNVNDAHREDDDVLLEYFADTTAPFPLHTVENAVWHAFAQQTSRRNPSFHREVRAVLLVASALLHFPDAVVAVT